MDSVDAHQRNQLALSILSHRKPTPLTVDMAIQALRGMTIGELQTIYPQGDA